MVFFASQPLRLIPVGSAAFLLVPRRRFTRSFAFRMKFFTLPALLVAALLTAAVVVPFLPGAKTQSALFAVEVTLLAASATSQMLQGPTGGPAYFIKCGSDGIQKCYEEAATVCPKGYTIVDKDTNPNAMVAPIGGMAMIARGPNSMLIECKN